MKYGFDFWLSLFLPFILFIISMLLIFFPLQSFYSVILILKRLDVAQRHSEKTFEDVLCLYQQDRARFARRYKQNIQSLRQSGIAFLVMAAIICMILFWF